MRFRSRAPSPLRRLLTAILTLSVLLATLGWAHPSCDVATGTHGGARPADGASHAAHGTPANAPVTAPAHVPANGGHDAPAAEPCAFVAHCGAVAAATDAPPQASEVQGATRAPARRGIRPLGPSVEPDSPPPKG